MYYYSFLYDYEIDTILYSNKKWTNGELLSILKDYKKDHEYCDTFYCDFLDYLVDTYDFKYLDIEDVLEVYDMRSIDYDDSQTYVTPDIPIEYTLTNLENVFKECNMRFDIGDFLDK